MTRLGTRKHPGSGIETVTPKSRHILKKYLKKYPKGTTTRSATEKGLTCRVPRKDDVPPPIMFKAPPTKKGRIKRMRNKIASIATRKKTFKRR